MPMRLLELELKNIKAYREATIAFGPGVNGLLGRNGAGKTTILQAIGYALFNSLGPAVKDFTREGQARGSIRVRMRSARDNLTYDIHRTVGGGSQNYVYNCDDDFKVQEGTGNVLAFVQEHLGAPGVPDMKTLFRDAVGIDQGAFQAPFLLGPAPRKDHFGPLLGIEKYRRIDADLNETRTYAQQQVADCQARLDRLKGQLMPLDDLVARQENLQTAVQALTKDIQTLGAARADSLAQIRKFNALEHSLQEVRTQHADAALKYARLEEQSNFLNRELAKARTAAQQATRYEPAHRRYREAERQLEPIEAQMQSWQGSQRQLSQLQGEVGLLQAQLQDKQDQIARLAQLQTRFDELQPAKQTAEDLWRQLDQYPVQSDRIAALTDALDALHRQLMHTEKDRDAIRGEVAERDNATSRLTEIQSFQTQQARDHQVLELRHTRVQTQRKALEEQLASLQRTQHDHSPQVRCPVCEQGLSRDLLFMLTARLETEIEDSARTLDKLQQQAADILQAQDRLQAESDTLSDVLMVCRDHRDLEICLAHLDRLQAEIGAQSQERTKLEAAQATRQQLQTKLDTLRPALTEWEKIDRDLVAQTRWHAERDTLRQTLRQKETDKIRLAAIAVQMAELEDQAKQLRLQQAEDRRGHRAYMAHAAVAQSLADRETEAAELARYMAQARQQLSDLERQQAALESQYEPLTHYGLRESAACLQTQLAGKEATLQVQQQNLAEVQRDVTALQALVQQRDEASQRLVLLKEREARVVWLKDLMRRALPQVTAALIQNISELANGFFCTLMGDHTRPLQWNAEFGIVLNAKGEERSFRQLSGGEQMAAALSVIMALLRRLSNVRFVFLDEPTSNLDVARRSQLAASLRNLGGFEQIFVISHDDTFEEHLDHVVRLEAGTEGSRVVVTEV